jgi:carboxypeptidase Taq
MERAYERATKIPRELVMRLTLATSQAFGSWRKAKENNDFLVFAPSLENVLTLRKEVAKLLIEGKQSVYDVMLDEFEPGLTEKQVEDVFCLLRPQLTKLAKELEIKTRNDFIKEGGLAMDEKEQLDLQMRVLRAMGYDFDRGRQDYSPHPFTITFGLGDVRITTWKNLDFRPGLFATIHEGGHGLYEQGVDKSLERMYLGETGGLAGGTGLAMHESQSRLWENIVGRSPEFLKMFGLEKHAKAVNVVKPSMIRVEADEVTYGLHIILRFEIEKDLMAGKIAVADLPEMWRVKMKELLGVVPESDREGVLQDVHWSHGAFGYFPTYLLGTLMAAQLWRTYGKGKDQKAKGKGSDLGDLREWLRVNIHQHGRIYPTNELFEKVTGEPLNPKYFLEYLQEKFEGLYN